MTYQTATPKPSMTWWHTVGILFGPHVSMLKALCCTSTSLTIGGAAKFRTAIAADHDAQLKADIDALERAATVAMRTPPKDVRPAKPQTDGFPALVLFEAVGQVHDANHPLIALISD